MMVALPLSACTDVVRAIYSIARSPGVHPESGRFESLGSVESVGRVKAALRPLPGYRWLGLLAGLAGGAERRRGAVVQILRPDNLFQPSATTLPDRYPDAFAYVRDRITSSNPRILSFGCSSGEELLSVLSHVPHGQVRGIDVNPLAVRAAQALIRRAGVTNRVSVRLAGDAQGEEPGSCDAIFAMAVFRHGSLGARPPTCDRYLRFADFDRTVTGLAAALRPGGLLVIRHANFRFKDCRVAREFERVYPLLGDADWSSRSPAYGPDDRLSSALPDDGVFRKLGAAT